LHCRSWLNVHADRGAAAPFDLQPDVAPAQERQGDHVVMPSGSRPVAGMAYDAMKYRCKEKTVMAETADVPRA
jgi:hypothetical protein